MNLLSFLKTIFVILFIFLCAYPAVSSAHGLVTSKSVTADNYIIEFEYDSTGDVIVGDLLTYTFELLDSGTQEQVPYDRVFVRFKNTAGTVLSASLLPVEGLGRKAARLNNTFVEPGHYTVELSFYRASEQLAQASFDFVVTAAPSEQVKQASKDAVYIEVIILETIALIGFGIWALRARRKK